MKSILFFILFFYVYLFSSNINNVVRDFQVNKFDSIGKDHLDRIWIRDNNTGKITFFINEGEYKRINSINQKGLIYDIDLDFGELFAGIGLKIISIFKDGNYKKDIKAKGMLLGICWINEKEIAIAILNEQSFIKILLLNIENNKEEELFALSNEKYADDLPFIYLKYFTINNCLYAFDFYNFRLKVYSFKERGIIYQAGKEIKEKAFDFSYIIKKESKKADKIISYNYLIPNNKFGIDNKGNFYVMEGCLNENTTYLSIFTLSEELKRNKYISLTNCYKNSFYYKNYLIFYNIKDSTIQLIELKNYD